VSAAYREAAKGNSLAQLRVLARAYLREVSAISYADLRMRQDPPWASVAFGAAGIAYALWSDADGARRARRLSQAGRWIRSASAARRGAFTIPGAEGIDLSASLHYSTNGIRFVELLVEHARGDRVRFERYLGDFVSRCRRTRGNLAEFQLGMAGHLTALLILHRHTGAPRAITAADLLASDLLARARGRSGWTHDETLGFAHGRAGIFHSLLSWSLARDRELPGWFFGALSRLAHDVAHARGRSTRDFPDAAIERQRRSWCGGAAGLTLMWVRAFERTGASAHLRLAREGARLIQTRLAAPADLCCGLTGRSYALLAMHRIDPAGDWYDHAVDLARRAADRMNVESGPWPNGLYKGYPGLVCLVLDLGREPGERIGFPLVDG
jgi:serine/threonine-protein kinase